jgi:hypothetical protein
MSRLAPPSPPAVVINADDLGKSRDINEAILAALEQGLATSATIMANMPGFADACAAIVTHGLQDRVGLHLNLTEGSPLSRPIRSCARFCSPEGQLGRQDRPLWRLSSEEAGAIEAELAAQVDAVLASGIRPSHVDSHHHVHTRWPVATIVMRIALHYGIPAIRLTRNCGPGSGLSKRAYKTILNARFARAGLAATRHFGSARDVTSLAHFSGPIEVMVHPSLDARGRLVDLTDGSRPLTEVLAYWQTVGTLVTYRELQARSAARREQ